MNQSIESSTGSKSNPLPITETRCIHCENTFFVSSVSKEFAAVYCAYCGAELRHEDDPTILGNRLVDATVWFAHFDEAEVEMPDGFALRFLPSGVGRIKLLRYKHAESSQVVEEVTLSHVTAKRLVRLVQALGARKG